jgi:hypothetical protein
MAPVTADAAEAQRAGQKLTLMGVAVVMGGCVLGGGCAIALHLVGQSTAAMAVAVLAGLDVLAGICLQVMGYRKLQAAKAGRGQ